MDTMDDKEILVLIRKIPDYGSFLDRVKIPESDNIFNTKLANYKKDIHKAKLNVIKNYLCNKKECDYELFDNANYKKYTEDLAKHIPKYIDTKKLPEYGPITDNIISCRIEYDMSPIADKYKNYDYTNLFDRLNKKYNFVYYNKIQELLKRICNSLKFYILYVLLLLMFIGFGMYCLAEFYDIIIGNPPVTTKHLFYIIMISSTLILMLFMVYSLCKTYYLYIRNKHKIERYIRILEPEIKSVTSII